MVKESLCQSDEEDDDEVDDDDICEDEEVCCEAQYASGRNSTH